MFQRICEIPWIDDISSLLYILSDPDIYKYKQLISRYTIIKIKILMWIGSI